MSLGGNTAYFGYKGWIGVEEETTFGTQITASSYFEFNSESMKVNRETKVLESINTSRDPIRIVQLNETVEGSIEADLNVANDGMVWLIKQGFGGTVTTTGTSTTGYVHTLALGNMEDNKGTSTSSNVKSLTLSVQKGDTSTAQLHFVGNRVNQLTISGEIGAMIKSNFGLIGKTATNTAEAHTVSFTDINPLSFVHASITTGSTTASLSATSIIGFEFNLANNLISDTNARELGSRTVKILPPTTRETTLKLTMRFDTTTAYTNFMALTPIAVKILMNSGATIGAGAGSTTYTMQLEFPKCYLTSNPVPNIGEKGILIQEMEFQCLKANTTTGYSVQAVVNNATANYY